MGPINDEGNLPWQNPAAADVQGDRTLDTMIPAF
jgi:hypothetical protein